MSESVPFFIEMSKCEHLNMTDIAVYGAVYFYSFKGEKTFCQSYDTTAGKLSVTKNTVKKSLKKLAELGVIEDLTPDRLNAPHDYKPVWIPEFGYQKLVSITDEGYQKLVSRVPKTGTQTPKRIPKFGTNKKHTNNLKNGGSTPPQENSDNGKKKKRKPSERSLAIGELEKVFIETTGIKQPGRASDKKFWYGSLGELYSIAEKDVDIGKKLVEFTINQMKRDELIITDPNSLVKTARAVMARRAQQKSSGFTPLSNTAKVGEKSYLNNGGSIG